MYPAIMKKVFAEFLGTAFLVAIVVGSGIFHSDRSLHTDDLVKWFNC